MGNPFSPTLGVAFWTFIVLGGLFLILWKKGFPIILQMTEEREARITKQLQDAERLQHEAQALLEEQRQLLASARGESQALLAEARTGAERERAAGVEKTRAEQEELLARARREIEAEREKAVESIRREAIDIAIAAAGKVIGGRLDTASDRKLVEDYIASIGPSK